MYPPMKYHHPSKTEIDILEGNVGEIAIKEIGDAGVSNPDVASQALTALLARKGDEAVKQIGRIGRLTDDFKITIQALDALAERHTDPSATSEIEKIAISISESRIPALEIVSAQETDQAKRLTQVILSEVMKPVELIALARNGETRGLKDILAGAAMPREKASQLLEMVVAAETLTKVHQAAFLDGGLWRNHY